MLFRNMSIVTRLASAFGLIVLCMVGLGLFSWYALKDVEQESLRAERVIMPLVEDAQRMSSMVAHSVSTLKDYFATSDVDRLSDGLTIFHAAWRSGQVLQKIAEEDPDLYALEVFLTSYNALYFPCLRDIQRAMAAHDDFARAREAMHVDIGVASRAVNDFLREYVHALRARSPREPREFKIDSRMSASIQGTWAVREDLLRARLAGDMPLALRTQAQWLALIKDMSQQYDVKDLPSCIPYLRDVEESGERATRSIQAYLATWRDEARAIEHVRVSSSQLLDSAQWLGMLGVELMGRMVNAATLTSLTGMRRILVITTLVGLLGLVLAYVLGRDITAPLRRCLRFAQSVASGNLGEPLALCRRDEIGLLADAINVMVGSLRRRIDELGAMERAIRHEEAISQRALIMAKAAFWHVDFSAKHMYVPSAEMDALVGIPLNGPRLLSEWYSWVAVVDEDAAMRLRHGLEGVLAGELTIFDIVTPLRLETSSETLWVRSLMEAVRDDSGQVISYLGITQDVTGYMRQQQVLEAATHAQSTFIASLSHEIRNPLNAIIGLGHLLRNTTLTERQRDYLCKCDGAAQLLLGLINDILDLSKIRAGEMRMEGIVFDLHDLLHRIMGMASGLNHAEGLKLDLKVASNVPGQVVGDPLRLQQVLTNLLTNACKFTPHGTVRLSVESLGLIPRPWPKHLDASSEVIRLRLVVSDTGIGMNREQMDRLFQPFAQADTSISRRYGGTGLGLTICQQLVALMGGSIAVTSHLARGSTFEAIVLCGLMPADPLLGIVTTPGLGGDLARVKDELSLDEEEEVHGWQVLVAEDDEINALIAREVLESMGYVVDTASNGAEAVAMAMGGSYDLVLMDLQMPVMDGITAARRLRKVERLRDLPILAMTAHAMQGDRERILEAGMDDHIPKPFDPKLLRATVERWLRKGREN